MKVAIVCDNYKLDKFKQKLEEKKIVYSTMDFNKFLKLTLITCMIEQDKIDIVAKICYSLEINFQFLNKNKN